MICFKGLQAAPFHHVIKALPGQCIGEFGAQLRLLTQGLAADGDMADDLVEDRNHAQASGASEGVKRAAIVGDDKIRPQAP